jgi:hypothetical protein
VITVSYILAAVVAGLVGVALAIINIGELPFIMLAVLFAVLKLAGIIAWSWWWTMLPLWGPVCGTIAKMVVITRDPFWGHRR